MVRKLALVITAITLIGVDVVSADPEADRIAFQKFYTGKFSDTPRSDFINGIYSIDKASRAQWEEIEEFPPYELDVDAGKQEYERPFANGNSYRDCFGDDDSKVRPRYPSWDADKQLVETLEGSINECRKANGEELLAYKTGAIAQISAYLAKQARGQLLETVIPEGDHGALAAYESGKQFFYSKRGQLNFSCADCHMAYAGNNLRGDRLSPAFGHSTHWPAYRSMLGDLGTLHHRFTGCNKQIRAQPFAAQGPEYRNLEYFLSYMSNGLELNGPGARK